MAIDDEAVRKELILPVDRESAWAALSDADELAGWLADEVELEIREGAEGWLRFEGDPPCRVLVEEVAEDRRLVLRWFDPEGPETIVEFTLDDAPEGTRLVVVELPVEQLELVGELLSLGPRVLEGPQMRAAAGPQLVGSAA